MNGNSGAANRPATTADEMENRLKWRSGASVFFLLLMISLLVVAIVATFVPSRTARGLPDADGVQRARALTHGVVVVATGGLRFRSALTGEAPHGATAAASQPAILDEAHAHLERASRASPFEARTFTALGHTELAMRRENLAEARYRHALELAPEYGEARLGLGLALARRASRTADANDRRRLELQAAAQFASVREDEPVYDCALYNSAVMSLLVGRRAAGERYAHAYLAHDSAGPWAQDLRALVGGAS